jgi:hypothetical protein
MVEAEGSTPFFRSISGVPLHHRLRARRGNGEDGMCTGSPPMCSESTWPLAGHSRLDTAEMDHALVAQLEERLPCKQRVARSNRRPGHQPRRVRLAGRGHLSFKEATRVRIPYTTPGDASRRNQIGSLVRSRAGRKPAAKIGRLRNS